MTARPVASDGRPLEPGPTAVATTTATAAAVAASPVATGFLLAWGAPDDSGAVEARGMSVALR